MCCNIKICQEFSVADRKIFWANILQLAQKYILSSSRRFYFHLCLIWKLSF